MSQTTYNTLDGTIILSDKFDVSAATQSAEYTPYFNNIDDEYIVTFINLENVKEFHKFTYDSLGLTEGRYLQQFYRVSRNGTTWSDWLDLKKNIDNFPVVDTKDKLFIEVKWVRKGISSIGSIRLLEYQLEGELERNLDESDGDVALLNGQTLIVKPPYIYKVFKIDDIEIISSTVIPSGYSIKYRYSQDSSRTWSQWEPFTKENITTTRINPIRFFQIEYFIENNS